jgi:drug/metabolite transporter (DMT)-like permease
LENRPALIGIACCAISALTYTLANICMRQLTILHCDTMWAVYNRELVTTLLIAPWLFYEYVRGRPTLPSGRTLWRLMLVGLLIEVAGNLCVQWAFGVVGLAVTIPAVYGVTIAGGAILGYFWLGERVSPRAIVSILLLLTALVLLGIGAESARRSIALTQAITIGPLMLALGVLAGGLAGMVYAILSITIRHSVTKTTRPSAVAFIIPLMGVVSLGPMVFWRLGLHPIWNTPWQQIALIFTAGTFNLIGFLAVINGLQRIPVAHANMVSGSQVGIAAIAGVLLFHEPPNPWLVLGVCLMIVGIVRFDRPTDGGVL